MGARHLGTQIVEILSGGNRAEMPFFVDTQWELAINLMAAKELGLEGRQIERASRSCGPRSALENSRHARLKAYQSTATGRPKGVRLFANLK